MKFYEKLILVNINNLYILSYSLRFNSDRWITSGFNLDHHMHMGHYLFPFIYLFIYFISTKSKNQMGHTASLTVSPRHALFWRCPPTESLKKPYFPLPLSILAGTNLNMLLLFFFATPVWFHRKSIPHSISE